MSENKTIADVQAVDNGGEVDDVAPMAWPHIDFIVAQGDNLDERHSDVKSWLDVMVKIGFLVWGHKEDNSISIHTPDGQCVTSFRWDCLSPDVFSDLVRLCDRQVFWKELNQLRLRMAMLGWKIPNDFCVDSSDVVMIDTGRGSSTKIYCSEGLVAIEQLERGIELEEVKRELARNREVLRSAGISIRLDGDNLKIVLRENDPELKRRATMENLNLFVELAYCWAKLLGEV